MRSKWTKSSGAICGRAAGHVIAAPLRRRDRRRKRRVAGMPAAGSGRLDGYRQPGLSRQSGEDRLGGGRAADVAQADEQDRGHAGFRQSASAPALRAGSRRGQVGAGNGVSVTRRIGNRRTRPGRRGPLPGRCCREHGPDLGRGFEMGSDRMPVAVSSLSVMGAMSPPAGKQRSNIACRWRRFPRGRSRPAPRRR